MPENFGPKAKTIVFVDLDTKRVLGFGPEGLAPTFPAGTRYETKIPFDAIELDKWVSRYGEEMRQDLQEKNYRQFLREQSARKAITDKLTEMTEHLDPFKRDFYRATRALQEKRYAQMVQQRDQVEHFLVAQGYDESFSGEDLAMENKRVQLT